jgi:hypothetical protein
MVSRTAGLLGQYSSRRALRLAERATYALACLTLSRATGIRVAAYHGPSNCAQSLCVFPQGSRERRDLHGD